MRMLYKGNPTVCNLDLVLFTQYNSLEIHSSCLCTIICSCLFVIGMLWCACTIVCLTIHVLKDMSCFQCGDIMNDAVIIFVYMICISICVHFSGMNV